jgi:hypothetical protein
MGRSLTSARRELRTAAVVIPLLLSVDGFFSYLLTYGIASTPGGIAFIFFLPAIPVLNRLQWLLPPDSNSLGPLFIIQFLLMCTLAFAILVFRKYKRGNG